MDIREIFDQLRTYHTKNVKPFEKLPEVIDAAIQVIEHDLPAAKRELEHLTTFVQELRASVPDVETEVNASKARVDTAQEQAIVAEDESKKRIGVAERLAEAREIQLVREFEHKGATLQREHDTRKEELEIEIMALEAKKAKLDTAIAAVRAQF